jgi:hypothetical protein
MQEEYWQFVEGAKEGAVSGRGQWKGRNAKRWCEAVRMTQRPSLRVRGNRRKSEKAAPAKGLKGVEKMTGERRSKRKAKGRKGRDARYAQILTACPGESSHRRK